MHLPQLFRKRNIFIFVLLFFGYLIFMNILEASKDVADNKEKIQMIEESIRSLANQGPCKMPSLPLNPPELMGFYTNEDPVVCDAEDSEWVSCDKSICYIKQSVINKYGKITCDFMDILRRDDFHFTFAKAVRTSSRYVLKESDFAQVKCWSESSERWYGKVFGIREGVGEDRKRWSSEPVFNVLMYGFDSLSRLAMMRKMPKTYEFLSQELEADVLEGYNIVGDGTPQALIPLLTGHTELELPETRKRKKGSEYVNVYPMIWKEYEQYGYITAFNEDVPNIGTFSYRLNGFNAQPTDHYQRLYYLAIESSFRTYKRLCVGSTPRHKVMLDYTKYFMQKYEQPRFVFSFHGELSHDSINLVGVADDDVRQWMRELKNSGVLDDTILIFMSDHGNRFADIRNTLQGKQEERLPFFSFVFPEKFKSLYKDEYRNFKSNLKRLVTPFDVHETLQDILRLQSASKQIHKPLQSRAISLFRRISESRSCADAYIEPHWCACLNWRQINSTSEEDVVRAANAVVERINTYTQTSRTLCSHLNLSEISWAAKLVPHNSLVKFKQNRDADGYLADLSSNTKINNEMYQVKIVTKPSAAIYEASVVHNMDENVFEVKISDISRVNMYGDQARCIMTLDPELRKFCYCK